MLLRLMVLLQAWSMQPAKAHLERLQRLNYSEGQQYNPSTNKQEKRDSQTGVSRSFWLLLKQCDSLVS
jgi:hypothetical protein